MGYDVVSRLLHWVTVLIVFVMIPVGLYMTQDGIPRATQDGLFKLHKGLGSIFLLVILARLAWRLLDAEGLPLAPLPGPLAAYTTPDEQATGPAPAHALLIPSFHAPDIPGIRAVAARHQALSRQLGIAPSEAGSLIRAYLDRNYTTDRMFVVAAGAVKHDEFVKQVEERFSSLPTAPKVSPVFEPARYTGGDVRETRDLMDARTAQQQPTVYEAQDVSVHGFDGSAPRVRYRPIPCRG